MIIPYASRTGTRRNLAARSAAGWRLLVSATGELRPEGFQYAIDNGAWTAHQGTMVFDEAAFVRVLTKLGKDADWTAAPDIVAGGRASLELSLSWIGRVLEACPRVLIPVQDGMVNDDLAAVLGPRVGIFIGGSPLTNWKEETAGRWAALARSRGAWCHMGRVNSRRRINICAAAGVDSFDGTSASKFAKTLPLLDSSRRQLSIITEEP